MKRSKSGAGGFKTESKQDQPSHDFLMHSWYNKTAHLLRRKKDGKIGAVRCRIREMECVRDGNITMRVEWNESDNDTGIIQLKHRWFTPAYILNAQSNWCFEKTRSSDDEEDAPHPIGPAVPLPFLEVSNLTSVFSGHDDFSLQQRRKLEVTMDEINVSVEFLQARKEAQEAFSYLTADDAEQEPDPEEGG